ncbi:hypothetical protein C922_05535 [Plasmodium inui San Antonio 1]|uniref:Uncharacterized protein n=1 Tax=Plasmodium inui San Antonio 1 TaxID=1237626 RepID=W7AFM5_9APIC|nr:hypothetical protein C922_05535 [Plasmodium inui San Antonio 1]EUD64086.1 hypothetical protein C922_05535 [Plasmodium inui San Antonio 1]
MGKNITQKSQGGSSEEPPLSLVQKEEQIIRAYTDWGEWRAWRNQRRKKKQMRNLEGKTQAKEGIRTGSAFPKVKKRTYPND